MQKCVELCDVICCSDGFCDLRVADWTSHGHSEEVSLCTICSQFKTRIYESVVANHPGFAGISRMDLNKIFQNFKDGGWVGAFSTKTLKVFIHKIITVYGSCNL